MDVDDEDEEGVVGGEEDGNGGGSGEGRALSSAPRSSTQLIVDPRLEKVVADAADDADEELDELRRRRHADANDQSDDPAREVGTHECLTQGSSSGLSASIHLERIVGVIKVKRLIFITSIPQQVAALSIAGRVRISKSRRT